MAGEDYIGFLSPSDLGAFQQSVQQDDVYGMTGRSLMGWQPDMRTWSPATQGITSFTKAFLGGLMQNYARNNASEQLASVVSVLPQLRNDPTNVAVPEGVDADAFNLLKGTAILRKEQLAAVKDQENRKFNSELLMRLLGKKADVMGEAAAYNELAGPATKQVQIGTNKDGSPMMQTVKAEGLAGIHPNSPLYKAGMDLKAEEDARRREIGMIPSVSQFLAMQKSLPLVKAFKDQDTTSSDVGFVYNYIKSLDEGAVRGEEINMAAAGNPLVQQYAKQFQAALDGSSKLTPALKNKMYLELLGAQQGVFNQAKNDSKVIVDIANQRGVTANLYPFDINMKFDSLAPVQDGGGASLQERAKRELERRQAAKAPGVDGRRGFWE